MSGVSRVVATALLAVSATATPAAMLFIGPHAGAAIRTAAHADASSPPSPDYVCDDLMTLRTPDMPFTQIHAANCDAQHGTPYGHFTNKIIAERHAPQAHIHCKTGLVEERARYFITDDIECYLVWPQRH
ncbi:hypothetical protein ACGFNU_14665 [Spirillospora sp. NPDC048911]|uniref:hypothetical protein n=1 Tax=Spirillospora sp. NPDC048911 TaxID=3364527 RepID=UPI0037246271